MSDSETKLARRVLHFDSLEAITADANALANAEKMGKLKHVGNWTLGQCCGHLAAWMNYAFDGFPKKAPWPIKLIGPMLKNRILTKGMPTGRQIPGVEGGTFGIEPVTTEEGLSRLHQSCDRLKSQSPRDPHPIFGPLTHDQWIQLQLRHAELHLSFQVIQ